MPKTTAIDGQYKQAISDLYEELSSLSIKTSALKTINNQLKQIITEQLPNCPIPDDGIDAAGGADHDQPESVVLDGNPERNGDTKAASESNGHAAEGEEKAPADSSPTINTDQQKILHLNEKLIEKLAIFKSLKAQNGRLKKVVADKLPEHPVLGGKATATDEHRALSGGGEQNVDTVAVKKLSFPLDLIRIYLGQPAKVTGNCPCRTHRKRKPFTWKALA